VERQAEMAPLEPLSVGRSLKRASEMHANQAAEHDKKDERHN
jgi:hypothetical protein